MSDTLTFKDPGELPRLRRLYQNAKRSGAESFTFQGHEVLTGYAKYMLQYLEGGDHQTPAEHEEELRRGYNQDRI